MKQQYDLIMKIKFCRIHKDFFSTIIKNNKKINPINLTNIIRMSSICTECKWEVEGNKK